MNRTCPDCGVALEDDEQFCGNCGCYLDWTDQPEPEPEAAPDAAPDAVPAEAATGPGLVGRVRQALTGDDAAKPPAAPPPGAPPPPPPYAPPSTPPPTAPPPSTPSPAQALVAPAPQQPGPQQPRAQQPRATPPRPPRRTAPAPEPLQPGDLVCGHCGTGNKPSRKFCRRCGETLAEAVVAKVPWWRRVFRSRGRKVDEAGTRPKAARARPRVPTGLVVLVVLVAGLGVGGFLLRDQLAGGVDVVQDSVEGVERRVPDGARASSAQPGHGAGLVIDGTTNNYWAPARPGEGRGEFVEVRFDDPVRLVNLLITPGVSKSKERAFLRQGRPSELRIVTTDDAGDEQAEDVELPDERGDVEVTLRASDVVSVRFEIVRSREGNAPRSRTAIAEVQFWVRE